MRTMLENRMSVIFSQRGGKTLSLSHSYAHFLPRSLSGRESVLRFDEHRAKTKPSQCAIMNSMESQLLRLEIGEDGLDGDGDGKRKKKPATTKKKTKKMVPKGTRQRNQEMLQAQCVEHLRQYFETLTTTPTAAARIANKIRFRPYSIHDFEIYCLLGSGGFGKVNNAREGNMLDGLTQCVCVDVSGLPVQAHRPSSLLCIEDDGQEEDNRRE